MPPQEGINWQSYLMALIETRVITRLAKTAGKTFGVTAVVAPTTDVTRIYKSHVTQSNCESSLAKRIYLEHS
jgi:hypothetical protein